MPSFQFRLKRVLEWYQTQWRVEENRLALCLAALNNVQERMARSLAENVRIEREVLAARLIPAQDLVSLGLYRLRAKIRTAEMQHERNRCEQAFKEQMVVVQAAQRRVRLVEKLRERQLSEHLYAEDRALENLAAEAYLSKWTAAKRRTGASRGEQ